MLPFANLNPDPEQQYLSDGITEDIITELARHRDFLVMARNASFQYREKTVDVKRVGRELGVEYLVEGSLRKAGKRLRITAQLVEVATGAHLWAERYDRDVQDVFTIQDDVTQTIAATLVGQLGRRVAERTRRKPTESWAAYDYYLQGREYALFRYEPATAKLLLKRALELDPTFASAHAVLSFVLVLLFFDDLSDGTLNAALAEAETALSLDENEPWSHLAMGFACTFLRRFDLAGVHHAKSVTLNPNDAQAAFVHAHWLTRVGRTEEALREFDRALRLDPFMPNIYWERPGDRLPAGAAASGGDRIDEPHEQAGGRQSLLSGRRLCPSRQAGGSQVSRRGSETPSAQLHREVGQAWGAVPESRGYRAFHRGFAEGRPAGVIK